MLGNVDVFVDGRGDEDLEIIPSKLLIATMLVGLFFLARGGGRRGGC